MPRFNVPSCLRVWPRVAVFALVGIGAAGCADSARFDSNPYASNDRQPPPQYTGSVSKQRAGTPCCRPAVTAAGAEPAGHRRQFERRG